MEMVLIFTFCLILAGTDAVPTVTGYRGRSVQIKCSYTSGYENYNKYLCRRKCSSWDLRDVPVYSASATKDSRFSLYDDTTVKVFTITITDLLSADKGTYWCGIERAGIDIYKEIRLLIIMDVPVISTVSPSTHTTHPASTHIMTSSVHAVSTHPTTANQLEEFKNNQTINQPIYNQTTALSFHDIPGIPGYIMMGAGTVLFAFFVIIPIIFKIKRQGSETVTRSPRKTNRHGEKDHYALSVQAIEKDISPECIYQNLDPALHQSDPIYQNTTVTNNL